MFCAACFPVPCVLYGVPEHLEQLEQQSVCYHARPMCPSIGGATPAHTRWHHRWSLPRRQWGLCCGLRHALTPALKRCPRGVVPSDAVSEPPLLLGARVLISLLQKDKRSRPLAWKSPSRLLLIACMRESWFIGHPSTYWLLFAVVTPSCSNTS